MRARIASALAISLMLGLFAVPQAAQAGCGFENNSDYQKRNRTLTETDPVVGGKYVQDEVAFGEFNQYAVQLSEGAHYVALVATFDVDVNVCRGSSSSLDCESTNPAVVPDGCLGEGLEGWPGMGDYLIGPGTFKIQIAHCFSLECGYGAADVGPDAAEPAIPYVLYVV